MARTLRAPVATLLAALALLAGCSEDEPPATPSGPVEPAAPQEATVAFQGSGTLTGVGGSTSPASPQGCDALQEEGVDVMHHGWEIVGDVNGAAADIVRMEVTLAILDATLLDADLYLESPDGEVLGSAIAFNAMAGPTETVVVEETLDPGTYLVIVRACAGRGSYEVQGEALLRTIVEDGGAVTNATASATMTSTAIAQA